MPYQDKRDDKGHARTVVNFAIKLLKTEKADPEVVIPAAILHDIGWSMLSEKERFSIFLDNRKQVGTFSGSRDIRMKHEKLGSELARKILRKLKYDVAKTKEIVSIIDGHDTRETFLSENDGIMRDADKLWRYSRKGFAADTRRRKNTPEDMYNTRKKQLNLKGYFYSKTAEKIASEELKKRKKEFRITLS